MAGNKIAAVNPSARRVIRGSRAEPCAGLCLQVGSAARLLTPLLWPGGSGQQHGVRQVEISSVSCFPAPPELCWPLGWGQVQLGLDWDQPCCCHLSKVTNSVKVLLSTQRELGQGLGGARPWLSHRSPPGSQEKGRSHTLPAAARPLSQTVGVGGIYLSTAPSRDREGNVPGQQGRHPTVLLPALPMPQFPHLQRMWLSSLGWLQGGGGCIWHPLVKHILSPVL